MVCGGNFTTFILDLNTESSSQLLYPSRQSKAGRIDPLKSSQVTGDVSDSEWKTLVLVAATVPGLALVCVNITRV